MKHEPPRPQLASHPPGRAAAHESHEQPELDFEQLAHEYARLVDLVATIERSYQVMQDELSSAQQTVEQLRHERIDAATRLLRLEARVLVLLRRLLGEQGIAALVEQLAAGEAATPHPTALELRLLHVLEGE
jgi:septal ring factor EnvC (AmiA/AmiB activator)